MDIRISTPIWQLKSTRTGLLEPVPGQSNGKARRYYLNLPRPKEPNEL